MKEYNAKDTFNCDVTVFFFFKMMPKRISAFKGDPYHEGKSSKERLNVLLCCNTHGSEKLTPIVMEKSKKPRYFQNTKVFLYKYYDINGLNRFKLLNTYFSCSEAFTL